MLADLQSPVESDSRVIHVIDSLLPFIHINAWPPLARLHPGETPLQVDTQQ